MLKKWKFQISNYFRGMDRILLKKLLFERSLIFLAVFITSYMLYPYCEKFIQEFPIYFSLGLAASSFIISLILIVFLGVFSVLNMIFKKRGLHQKLFLTVIHYILQVLIYALLIVSFSVLFGIGMALIFVCILELTGLISQVVYIHLDDKTYEKE